MVVRKPVDIPDPLIDEVRERRRELWDECGQDFDKFLEMIKELQSKHPEKIVDRRKRKPGKLPSDQ